jgi:hypothetical protein
VKRPWWQVGRSVRSGLVLGAIFSAVGIFWLVMLLSGSASLLRIAETVLYFVLASACFLSSAALRRRTGSAAGLSDP